MAIDNPHRFYQELARFSCEAGRTVSTAVEAPVYPGESLVGSVYVKLIGDEEAGDEGPKVPVVFETYYPESEISVSKAWRSLRTQAKDCTAKGDGACLINLRAPCRLINPPSK